MGDFNHWDEDQAYELELVENDVWVLELEFPADAYVEYIFIDADQERIFDPFNPHKTPNGMGKTNQYFYMKAGKPTPWISAHRETPKGLVSRAVLDGGQLLAGGKRSVHFYQPATDEPSPLLLVWDGGDYYRRAKLVTMLDEMIAARRIRPVALAMPENGGQARIMEYACSETTLWFVLASLLPEAQRRLHLLDIDETPGAFGVLGASMGGLMALYTGLRLPHIFGNVLAQSGAYELDGYEFMTSYMIEHGPKPEIKIWMDVGQLEGLLDCNRAMRAKLAEHGYLVDYHEYPAGHNYPAWRNELPGGLESLFG
jgi:enterochelin esterase family protein